ncbi:DUF5343 domain-containing protein [Streptomyces microflavus]|uniref:DUF5343 domain-containing protein n=1 Tax=Streptomyces microflavus TaxID=1919 RepID=UPI002E309A90|nr:DUF5343 domain-containing protein [Streptomyces microflavus]
MLAPRLRLAPWTPKLGAIVQVFEQLRKSVPSNIDADYLRRFNIAPANESYVIAVLRFLGIIDEDGNRIDEQSDYLYTNADGFQSGLERAIRTAYSRLFDDMNDALQVERENLIHWFRAADKTSELVGKRQASTFRTLAVLAGNGSLPARANAIKKPTAASDNARKKTSKRSTPKRNDTPPFPAPNEAGDTGSPEKAQGGHEVGLTVRIEVNLPSGGDGATYDAIFASIKKHLMS